jgi:short-subunit dehydrogenase
MTGSWLQTLAQATPRPVALVTGASAGLGALYAERLARAGFRLVLVARRRAPLEVQRDELSKRYGVEARAVELDLSLPGAAMRLHQSLAGEDWGQVSVLVNNAGFGFYGPFTEQKQEDISTMCQVHMTTVAELTQLFLPGMLERRRGLVLNVASGAAFTPIPYFGLYAATKAFVLSFSQALAAELGNSGVRVVCACPGATATDFHRRAAGVAQAGVFKAGPPEEVVDASLAAVERGDWVVVPGIQTKVQTLLLRALPARMAARVAGQKMQGRLGALRAPAEASAPPPEH